MIGHIGRIGPIAALHASLFTHHSLFFLKRFYR